MLYTERMHRKISKKYHEVIFVDSGNSDFQNKSLGMQQLEGMFFEEVYVPSSSPYFRDHESVFFFIDKLSYKNKILYDCYGNKQYYCTKSRPLKKLQYIEAVCLFKFFMYMYNAKNILRGE